MTEKKADYITTSTEQGKEILGALTSIYLSIVNVNFEDGKLFSIVLPEVVMSYMAGDNLYYRDIVPKFLSESVTEPYREGVKELMDPDTIVDRMTESGMLSMNYVGATLGWIRIRFIPSKRDANGRVIHAMFCTQDINREKEQERQMTYMIEHDPLTHVLNRTGFNRLSEQYKAMHMPIGFLMIDIDYFKQYNDTYGHETGDRILIKVAHALSDFFRTSDYVFRMGGDEFAMFLPGCLPKKGAAITKNKIRHINHNLSHPKDHLPPVTISVGMAVSPDGYHDDLYTCADAALYEAKREGRGRCMLAPYPDCDCSEKPKNTKSAR